MDQHVTNQNNVVIIILIFLHIIIDYPKLANVLQILHIFPCQHKLKCQTLLEWCLCDNVHYAIMLLHFELLEGGGDIKIFTIIKR